MQPADRSDQVPVGGPAFADLWHFSHSRIYVNTARMMP
jgi:hypothetical protein